MAPEHKGKQRGKYTTKACEECRRRRVKCDGLKPACSRCLQWQISCQYSSAEDGRRPAPKTYVLQLRQRIEALERLLERHGIDPHEGKTSAAAIQKDTSVEIDELTESFEGRLALDEALNFDRDGEMRYFGPMSGRLQFESSSKSTNSPKLHAEDSASMVPPAIFDPVDAVTAELGLSRSTQEQLIQLYFTWENPWFAVVDEELFRRDMVTGGRYWSPLLHLSILAVGSRYSHRLDVRSDPDDLNTAGRIFLEHAKPYLQTDMERPSVTTIQALVALGMFYIATGADAAGWLFHGMANRLCLDMGLNLDPAGFQETNTFSPQEVQLRRQIYWALYCHDKWSSLYTGRICSMLDPQGAVKVPDEDDKDFDSTGNSVHGAFKSLQRAMIRISQIQEKIILSLWAPKSRLPVNKRSSFFRSCLLDLKTWFYDLPSDLRIERPVPNNIPQVYTLHMIYHTTRIILTKPFTMRKAMDDSASNGNDHGRGPNLVTITDLALSVSRESARAICLAGQKYRSVFGSFQQSPISATHCTLSAALVLLGETETESNGGVKGCQNPDLDSNPVNTTTSLRNRLRLCLTVLEELGNSWHPARHIARNLRKLCLSVTCDETFSVPGTDTKPVDEHTSQVLDPTLDAGVEQPNSALDLPSSDLDRQIGPDQMGSALPMPNYSESFVPVETLPVDYGFFDILNEATWDQMW